MIVVDGIDVSYGNVQVLWDLSFQIAETDRVVAIVGPNGAGKSTLLRVMSGLHPVDDGRVTAWGDDVAEMDPTDVVRRGFSHVTEEGNLFDDMTVRENLEMGAYTRRDALDERLAEVFALFPVLEAHAGQRAGVLSGGQRQMLAIGRGLMAGPKILALDEPTNGLAPQVTARLFEKIEAISNDVIVLLVAQHVHGALELAERGVLLEHGEIVAEDTGPALLESAHIADAYL